MRAKVIFYDERTGEIVEEVDKAIFIGTKPYVDKGFTKVFVAFLLDIIGDPDYGKGAWRLLFYIATRMDYNLLEIVIVPEKTAKEMGVTRQSVYNWLNVLLKKGILEKIAVNVYRLKPYTVIKGRISRGPNGKVY
jgi:hypothetical protein